MLDQLEALAALARHGTMTKAGTALRVSQSAVSKRLAALEAQLGRKLVEREGRRSRLGPEGHRVLEDVGPLLAELRSVLGQMDIRASVALRMGVAESLLGSWGASVLAEVRRKKPALALEVHAHRSPVVLDRVRAGEYALGLVAGSCEQAPDLDLVILGEEPMVIISSTTTPSRRAGGVPLLSIEPRSATWESIAPRARRLGLAPEQTLESFFAVAQMALQGFGDGLVPAGVARALGVSPSRVRDLPRPGMKRPISLVGRRTTMARPAVQELAKHLREAVARKLRAA